MSKARKNPASRARVNAKWTPELVAEVADLHREGAYLNESCALVGGTYDGLRDAMAREPEYAAQIAKAHAERAAFLRGMVEGGDDSKNWRWLLERWSRENYAPPTSKVESKAELTGKDGAPLVAMSLEDLAAAAARKASEE